MAWTWEDTVKHYNVPPDLFVIVSDNINDTHSSSQLLSAGRMLERLNINKGSWHKCDSWFWIEFDDIRDAMIFKLAWTNNDRN